jgi:hypothetical protein
MVAAAVEHIVVKDMREVIEVVVLAEVVIMMIILFMLEDILIIFLHLGLHIRGILQQLHLKQMVVEEQEVTPLLELVVLDKHFHNFPLPRFNLQYHNKYIHIGQQQ